MNTEAKQVKKSAWSAQTKKQYKYKSNKDKYQ